MRIRSPETLFCSSIRESGIPTISGVGFDAAAMKKARACRGRHAEPGPRHRRSRQRTIRSPARCACSGAGPGDRSGVTAPGRVSWFLNGCRTYAFSGHADNVYSSDYLNPGGTDASSTKTACPRRVLSRDLARQPSAEDFLLAAGPTAMYLSSSSRYSSASTITAWCRRSNR
jgi:hypothetical protein